MVKIKKTCTGTTGTSYSNGPTVVLPWNISSGSSADTCVVQYTSLPDATLTITAMAIDSNDNLWVRLEALPYT